MRIVAVIFGLYAISWGLAPYTDYNLLARLILDISDWPIDRYSSPLDKNTMWLSSIGAGLLGAFSVVLASIVAPAIKSNNTAIINSTIIAMLVWYIIDSGGSIAADVVSNVLFNTIYLLLVLTPLICIKSHNKGV